MFHLDVMVLLFHLSFIGFSFFSVQFNRRPEFWVARLGATDLPLMANIWLLRSFHHLLIGWGWERALLSPKSHSKPQEPKAMREVPALTGRNAETQQERPKCGYSETSVNSSGKGPDIPSAACSPACLPSGLTSPRDEPADFLGPRPMAGTLKSLSLSFPWSPEGSLSNQTQKWKRKSSPFVAQLITHPSAVNVSNKIPPSPQQTHKALTRDRPHTSPRDLGWDCAVHGRGPSLQRLAAALKWQGAPV